METEHLIKAFVIFLGTMGPLDNIGPFAALTKDNDPAERRWIALKAVGVATSIILVFGILGDDILRFFGIGMPEFKMAGGLVLLLAALKMVTASDEPDVPSPSGKVDIAIYPLAIPIIAAPDALAAMVMQVDRARGDLLLEAGIIGMAIVVNVLVLFGFLATGFVLRVVGPGGVDVLSRVMGLVLIALGMEFIVEGVKEAGLLVAGG
jgi:multiple antibiotic resistance protein